MLHGTDLLRKNKLPHIWCPGCGNGTLAGALARAIMKLSIDTDKIALITGIGCSARFNNIMSFETFQTVHGRALAFATGFKMARPEMKVLVVTGDGDGAGIGGNHLIHSARRNIDITVLLINNSTFGMTGGQYSPLTPLGASTSTASETFEYPFNVCELVKAAGATYIARSTVYHVKKTETLLGDAINHKGFSFIEVITQCPTGYGKRNKFADPYEMLMWQSDNAIPLSKVDGLSEKELGNKFIIGKLYEDTTKIDFGSCYQKIIDRNRSKDKV